MVLQRRLSACAFELWPARARLSPSGRAGTAAMRRLRPTPVLRKGSTAKRSAEPSRPGGQAGWCARHCVARNTVTSSFGALRARRDFADPLQRLAGVAGTIDSSVALAIDEVNLGRPNLGTPLLMDLERVEVLNGPQGLLFGKNASAGLLNIVTAKPRLGEYSGGSDVEVTFRETPGADRNASGIIARQVLNIPVSANSALRIWWQRTGHCLGDWNSRPRGRADAEQGVQDLVARSLGNRWSEEGMRFQTRRWWARGSDTRQAHILHACAGLGAILRPCLRASEATG